MIHKTVNDAKIKQTKFQPTKKAQTYTHIKPTNKPHQPASRICSFLGSDRKQIQTPKKEIWGTGFSKGVYVWFEVESTGEKEIVSSQIITVYCKNKDFCILKLQVKATNGNALLDESFLQVSCRRLLKKRFLNPDPLIDPPHAMAYTGTAEKPPWEWKQKDLYPCWQIRQFYSSLCGIWGSSLSYLQIIFYVQLRQTDVES